MKKKNKTIEIMKDIFPFLWTDQEKIRTLFLISFGLVFIVIGLNLSIPLVLKKVVLKLSVPDKSMTYQLSLLLISSGIIWILSQIIQQIRQIIMVKPLERCIRLFCSKLFDHLHSLPMDFHLNRKTGAITNALERAQNGFPNIFWGLFLIVIPTVIELFLASSILCYFYGMTYGLIILVTFTTFIIFTIYAIEWASHYQTLCNEQQANTNANIVDSLLNFASVKYFNNKKYEVLKCDNHLKLREKLLIKSISSLELVRIGQSVIIGIGVIFLTYVAGHQTLSNIYNVSDFVLINGYILQLAAPLSQMGFVARDIRKGSNELASVMEIYKTKPIKPQYFEGDFPLIEKLESVQFKNVFFGYDDSRFVLKDINFFLQSGRSIGIVGETGSGKSTISNLLFKFYNATSGKILINDQDINSLKSEDLSSLFGVVSQDVTLFNTTIYENILFARPTAIKTEVEEAMQLAQLESVLKKLPHHYNTVVGERGLKLSGGEKQRIAIARILLRRPSLYIFDEATSSLDLKTEEIIMKNIEFITKSSSSIIIAHRLSAVMNADEILVLNNGIVEERGTHLSLLKQRKIYFSLWKSQSEALKDYYAL